MERSSKSRGVWSHVNLTVSLGVLHPLAAAEMPRFLGVHHQLLLRVDTEVGGWTRPDPHDMVYVQIPIE